MKVSANLGAVPEPLRRDASSSSSSPDPYPWLKHLWVKSQDDLLGLKYPFMVRAPPSAPPHIDDAGGMFRGQAAFTRALMQDLPLDLAERMARCPMATMGGKTPTGEWSRPASYAPGRVWIFVNGETSPGVEFWQSIKEFLHPADKGVILGNWWNSTHETFHDSEVTSLWVPFASTSFAERAYRTPLDLVDRQAHTRFDRERKYLVAYQQKNCDLFRETFWDLFNEELKKRGARGSAISACNGLNHSGLRLSLAERSDYANGYGADESMGRYESFSFVWAAEHGQNGHGYVTEKIVNAFLAGAVPIYGGASQVSQIFDPSSFVNVDLNHPVLAYFSLKAVTDVVDDPGRYEKMLHRTRPVVADEAMRRFFSWHPAVWKRYGDGLRRQILEEALRLCESRASP